MKLLEHSDEDKLLNMYDPVLVSENIQRLTNPHGIGGHPRYGQFVNMVADKEYSTVRIPPLVEIDGCGYFEDRRPSSALDPYSAADGIIRASIFGDFLKPGFEHLNEKIYK